MESNYYICFRMKLFNRRVLSKLLLFFLTAVIFNLSVDVKDYSKNYIPEDLSFNDQESIVELIVEKWLGFSNAFIEYDEPDQEDGVILDFHKITLAISSQNQSIVFEKSPIIFIKNSKRLNYLNSNRLKTPFLDILSPPPKV